VQPFAGRFQDPNRISLRKAGRAAIILPLVLAVGVATGNDAAALFASFGALAALVFSDFGGPLPRRFRAYVALAVIGGLLIAVGSGVADTIYPAAVVTGIVAFLIAFSGALGGYFASGGSAATLAIVLAVMTPGVEADLLARETGWIAGVLLSGVAAVLLWPVHQRDRVRQQAAQVLHEAAAALRTPANTRDLTALGAADAELGRRAGVVYRPVGSITRERALVALLILTRRLPALLDATTAAERSVDADPSPEYAALVAGVADALDTSAQILTGALDAGLDVDAMHRARSAHVEELERWVACALAAEGATHVIDRFSAVFPARRLALAAAQIGSEAHDAMHDTMRSRSAGQVAVADPWALLRAHCNLRSVRLRNAARFGLGLGLAVFVAKTTSVQHAFWVVLAALSVLRSSALGTGATALQAVLGALIGFGVASAVMVTVGGDDVWLWILFPIVAFLAAYTPGAVNYVVGQAGFTVLVVMTFNLIVPGGWRTGLVRVEDIAIGAVVAVVVGAFVWPRGARGVARRSFAELLRAGSAHLQAALDVTLRGSDHDLAAAEAAVSDARARADAALADLALEHGGGHVDREGWGMLLIEASMSELAAAGIGRVPTLYGAFDGCADTRHSLEDEGSRVTDGVERDARRLLEDGVATLANSAPVPTPLPPTLAGCLANHAQTELHQAIGLIWVHEWLTLAGDRPH
jgi:uncharacterized membrane protein YccC